MATSSNDPWRASCGRHVEATPSRVAVVGVGHALRGDDAAGLVLAQRAAPLAGDRLLVVEGGPVPENITGLLRRFKPDLVLLVDAADLGAEPGAVRWLTTDVIEGLSATTHTMPLSMLARYLQHELDCSVCLVGIQPAQNDIGQPLSDPVEKAVIAVSEGLRAVFA